MKITGSTCWHFMPPPSILPRIEVVKQNGKKTFIFFKFIFTLGCNSLRDSYFICTFYFNYLYLSTEYECFYYLEFNGTAICAVSALSLGSKRAPLAQGKQTHTHRRTHPEMVIWKEFRHLNEYQSRKFRAQQHKWELEGGGKKSIQMNDFRHCYLPKRTNWICLPRGGLLEL